MTTKNGKKAVPVNLDIRERCDRALELERQIKLLQAEQKAVEKDIRAFAKDDKEAKMPTEGGGWSKQYPCTDGSYVRVTKDGDTLRSEIADTFEDLPKVRKLAGGAFDYLFTTTTAYALVANFRAEAAKLVPNDSEKLIDLVSNCGKTKINYQVAKKPEAA